MLQMMQLSFGDISKIKLNDKMLIYWGDEKIGKLKKGLKYILL